MAARMTPRFRDLTDVDWETFADGEVATYGSGTDTLTGEPGGGDATVDLATHAADTTNVHGIADMTALASDAELAAHIADTTFIHGISSTADLATDAEVASAVSTHSSDTTSVHGITDTTVLATDAEVAAAVSAHESDTTVHGVDTANVPSSGEKAALAGTSGTPSVSNRFVTEDDPALGGGGDLADAVVLEPATGARNVVQPSADVVPLTVKGKIGQSEALQQWENSDGDVIAVVYADGSFSSQADDGSAASGFLPTGEVSLATAAATDPLLEGYLPTENYTRTTLRANGSLEIGDGTVPADTTLERTGVGELSVNGEPIVLDDDARLTGGVDQGDIDTTVATHSADTTSVHGIADTSALLTTSAAAAAYQPVDSDLTAIAALTTTSFGRGLLSSADAAALLASAGAQASDSDLTAIAALTTTSYGRSLLTQADAAAAQTTLGVSTFIKTLLDDTDAATARTTLGVSSAPTIASLSNWWTFAPVNAALGGEIGTTTGMVYVLGIFVPVSCTLTGILAGSGPTVNGTAKACVGFYDATGALVANSNLAGQVVTGANTYQKIPFTSTYAATGPALYFASVQLDGTGTRIRHINVTDATVSGYLGALTKSVAGTFGTLPTITPPTGPTATIGPVLATY